MQVTIVILSGTLRNVPPHLFSSLRDSQSHLAIYKLTNSVTLLYE